MLNETSDLKDVVSLMIPAADVIDQIALEKLSRLLADDLDSMIRTADTHHTAFTHFLPSFHRSFLQNSFSR